MLHISGQFVTKLHLYLKNADIIISQNPHYPDLSTLFGGKHFCAKLHLHKMIASLEGRDITRRWSDDSPGTEGWNFLGPLETHRITIWNTRVVCQNESLLADDRLSRLSLPLDRRNFSENQ